MIARVIAFNQLAPNRLAPIGTCIEFQKSSRRRRSKHESNDTRIRQQRTPTHPPTHTHTYTHIMAPDNERPAARSPPPGTTAPPDQYETFHGSKPEDRDGSISTAASAAHNAAPQTEGGGNKRPSITEGLKTIKQDDWLKIHQIPCAREGFMTGIATGFVTGFGRLIAGGKSAICTASIMALS